MSQLQVNQINDASGGVLAPISSVMRNRIINGSMRIDQRNAGAAVTLTNNQTFIVDRWSAAEDTDGTITAQQSTAAPAGFTNSFLFTTGTADASLSSTQFVSTRQPIEGFNVADLGWGTANAKTVTLSFWVRSSLTGTFGGSLRNSASDRSYPFSYTILLANTWEQKSITIAGDTTGTWLTNNGIGIALTFGLGVGSNFVGTAGAWAAGNFISVTGATSVIGTAGATWQITGVQLEVGTQATSFEYRPYGTELQLCQRYYEQLFADSGGLGVISGGYNSFTNNYAYWQFMVQKRAGASAALIGGSWAGATPTFYTGTTKLHFYSAATFYLGATSIPCLAASAEL